MSYLSSNSTAATVTVEVEVDENDPCGGGIEYKLDGEIFYTPEEYEDARLVQYEQEQEESERQCEACQERKCE